MKYCIQYYKNSQALEKADEFIINYTKKNDVLIDFLEKYKEKRINLTIDERLTYGELRLLKTISDNYPNLVIRFENYDAEIIDDIVECGFPFFFGNRVNNWDEFLGLIDLAVTDIYVVEDLCFELDKVAAIAHAADIRIRIFPNVAQSSWRDTPDMKKFWVRPEDIDFYSDYVDVCEFFGNAEQMPVLIKIYKQDKQWFGLLNEIIIGLKTPLDSRFVHTKFPDRRIRCGKDCRKGGKCELCDRIVDLSYTLKEAHILIKPKRKED